MRFNSACRPAFCHKNPALNNARPDNVMASASSGNDSSIRFSCNVNKMSELKTRLHAGDNGAAFYIKKSGAGVFGKNDQIGGIRQRKIKAPGLYGRAVVIT